MIRSSFFQRLGAVAAAATVAPITRLMPPDGPKVIVHRVTFTQVRPPYRVIGVPDHIDSARYGTQIADLRGTASYSTSATFRVRDAAE